MRRAAALVIPPARRAGHRRLRFLVLVAVLAASTPPAAADTYKSVTVTGAFGKAPTVTIPKVKGSGGPLHQDAHPGHRREADHHGRPGRQLRGVRLVRQDQQAARLVLHLGDARRCSSGQLLPGLETALIGQQVGSRVLAVIPPTDAFGTPATRRGHRRQRHAGVRHRHGLRVPRPGERARQADSTRRRRAAHGRRARGQHGRPDDHASHRRPPPPKALQVKTLIKGTGRG